MTGKLMTIFAALALVLGIVACGGDEEEDPTSAEATTETTAGVGESGACTEVEEVEVEEFGNHEDREFTAADYETNPPAGGDHNPTALAGGTFYPDPQPLGEAVHLLEHGGVIGWTNDLSKTDQKAVENAFNEVFGDGYNQLATIENPDLESPFALSAWGYIQTCAEPDTSVIRPFIEEHYAPPTSGESALACQGEARRLPPCKELKEGL